MVAVEIGSIGHFMLLRALEKAGLTLKDVSIENMVTTEAEKAFGEKGKPGPLFANTETFQEFLLEYRVLKKKKSISDILNPRFIRKLAPE